MQELRERIEKLKQEKDAVILAHYYVNDEVQAIADYVGDSYYLAKVAASLTCKVICFCGVRFMAESAKIMNPDKTVLLPVEEADCEMAHMVQYEKVKEMREKYPDICVVTYINSTAETKTYSDVCVTSANAVKIVSNLEADKIFFIPDQNLGAYVKKQVPSKEIFLNDGYCPVHHEVTLEDVSRAKKAHPNVKLLAHPECKPEILQEADYVGSTSGIIDYATNNKDEEFIIATEFGVAYELMQKNPEKKFYPVKDEMVCKDMKLTTLESVYHALETMSPEVTIDDETRKKALIPLQRMLELAQ